MLLWRMKSIALNGNDGIECHLIRRDMEYRLSIRIGKDVVAQETHRTPAAAAERAEEMRRRAMDGSLKFLPAQTPAAANGNPNSEKNERTR
jgi:hypothetical protein